MPDDTVGDNDFSQKYPQVAVMLQDLNTKVQDNTDLLITLIDTTARLRNDPAAGKLLKLANRFARETGEDVDDVCERLGCGVSTVRKNSQSERGPSV